MGWCVQCEQIDMDATEFQTAPQIAFKRHLLCLMLVGLSAWQLDTCGVHVPQKSLCLA